MNRKRVTIAAGLLAALLSVLLWTRSTPKVLMRFEGYSPDGRWALLDLTNSSGRYITHEEPRIEIQTPKGWAQYYVTNGMCCLMGPGDSHFGQVARPMAVPLPPGPCRWRASMHYTEHLHLEGPGWRMTVRGVLAQLGLVTSAKEVVVSTAEFSKDR